MRQWWQGHHRGAPVGEGLVLHEAERGVEADRGLEGGHGEVDEDHRGLRRHCCWVEVRGGRINRLSENGWVDLIRKCVSFFSSALDRLFACLSL